MKPNFALSLSYEGIQLLQRQENGWGLVGEVDLSTADMAGELAHLRDTAASMGRGPLETKLIIPQDQIKYLSVDASDLDKTALHDAVLSALDGATPYPVDELAFDFWIDGGQVQIAATAQETLAEAEAFATEYGFSPIGFVAAPDRSVFGKEPSFGLSKFAREKGVDALEPDAAVAVANGPAVPIPAPAPEPQQVAAPPPEPAKAPQTPEEDVAQEPAPASFSSRRAPVQSDRPDEAERPRASTPMPKASRADTEYDAAPPSLSGVSRTANEGAKPSASLPPAAQIPPGSARAPQVTGKSQAVRDEAEINVSLTGLRPGEATADYDGIPRAPVAFSAAPRAAGLSDATPAAAPAFSAAAATDPQNSHSGTAGKLAALATSAGTLLVSGTQQLLKKRKPKPEAVAVAPAVVAAKDDEKQRMTVFGARKPKSAKPPIAVGGKPRFLGLILTAILLLFLVTVAAWASVFLDDGLARFFGPQNRDKPIVALPAPQEIVDDTGNVQVAALDEGLADIDDETVPALSDALPEPMPAPPPLTAEEAQAKYAATGIWQATPVQPLMPNDIVLDDVYTASIDASITGQDAFALTALTPRADSTARTMNRAVPPGSTFVLDENGFVKATPDGATTPEGALVFLGRPAVVPPSIPERLRRAAEPEVTQSAPEAEALPQPAITSEMRPRPRPDGLIESTERSLLGGVTLAELSKLRPRTRPELAKQAEEEETAAAPATAQAVAVSRKPDARPGNFAKIIARAAQQKQQQPENVTQVAAVAPRSVKPKIPSSASVAKTATVKNAINLSRVNLIGVYGKPSSRRALVRLSSGRYKKVKVGDRVDGGRVSAIGEAQLNYTKNGRSITLRMPKG